MRVFAYVTNIFNEDDELLIFDGTEQLDGTAQLVDPREYGVGLEVSF